MANLRLPTLEKLQTLPKSDAFEWLSSLEIELTRALATVPETDKRNRRNIEARLQRLHDRREEYKASS